MRNVVTHVYFGVDLQIVWDTIRRDLPVLAQQLQALLAAEMPPQGPPGAGA